MRIENGHVLTLGEVLGLGPRTFCQRLAHDQRAVLEVGLDRLGWPYRPGLSRWLDVLQALEEHTGGSPVPETDLP
ncbi:MAG: hypothetical protein L0027_16750 [Candidatus Rokubacteria bacterium]|nr:hypothetical protein [Candidatus Rokubacteria bacterium]